LQPFPVNVNPHLNGRSRAAYTIGSETVELRSRDQFIPLNFSAPGSASGPVVFVGYGITAAEYGYDDYDGIDVQGKIAVMLRHEPQEFDRHSIFEGRVYTEHAQLGTKAANARRHRARAVVLVNDTANHSGADALDQFLSLTAPADSGIPVIQAKADVIEACFRAAGRDFRETQEAIDRELHQRSFTFPAWVRMEVQADVTREQRNVSNVIGLLPGQTNEYVIIGAHYDHLGLGEQYSLGNNAAGKLHPGADDNASGAAGVLELARWFHAQPKPRRGILFMTFAGEELGLLGSSYYVHQPLLPPNHAVAMINLDMIGRLRDGKVLVGGSHSGSTFTRLLGEVQRRCDLTLDTSDEAVYGSSDHTSFLTLRLPVLFFFTGLHSDYHRPSDTWDKIDAVGTARLLEMVADVASSIANAAQRPDFVGPAQAPAGNADKM
jgi:hypothetical protein